eukprot:TRINITY_DN1147_c0_g1_i1.p1 TRINITY_DN1147_c0_g1~~TRINITY_DN1147_c0_g1_i1.p1  ORF type:complete len:411 (-),score=83.36 TRINITY_DN1147_c0_g1_i1:52-1284(-)
MSTTRPLVQVRSIKKPAAGEKPQRVSATLPAIFGAPIRPDVVRFTWTQMNKNRRQPYAVSPSAGHQTSAESWGTGRAVARIPRVPGGGTHRAGQAAFGNMCRGGRMFAPTKTWRRWHRRISTRQKRFALASAVSATGVTGLVLARGHKIERVPEIPLVVQGSDISGLTKTKEAVKLLRSVGAYTEVDKVKDSRKIRAGAGKARGRRYVQRLGPLIILSKQDKDVSRAFRNIPGVDIGYVDRLNLLQLAPGGHLGRFCIWTQDAFEQLDKLYGTYKTQGPFARQRGRLPRAKVTNADLHRIVSSEEVRSQLRAGKRGVHVPRQRKNPLKNRTLMHRLNPYERSRIRKQLVNEKKHKSKTYKRDANVAKTERQRAQKRIKRRSAFYKVLLSNPTIYETSEPKKAAPKPAAAQ